MSPVGTLPKSSGFFLPRSFWGLVLVIIALQALAKTAAGMGLFADGSYFLLRVLAYPQIPDAEPWRRWLAHVVWENAAPPGTRGRASTDQPYYLFLFVLPGCYTGCSVDSFVVEAAIIVFLLAFLDDVLYCSS